VSELDAADTDEQLENWLARRVIDAADFSRKDANQGSFPGGAEVPDIARRAFSRFVLPVSAVTQPGGEWIRIQDARPARREENASALAAKP
jgi:hypothetical protein